MTSVAERTVHVHMFKQSCMNEDEGGGLATKFQNQCVAKKQMVKEIGKKEEKEWKEEVEEAGEDNGSNNIQVKGIIDEKICLCNTHDSCNNEDMDPIDSGPCAF